MSRVKKPSAAEAATLSKCFPTGSGGGKKAFDPNDECVVKGQQVKKKKSIPIKSKPSTIEVILLQDYQEDVPKGTARNKLKKCGRVLQIKLTRVMSTADVERVIKRAFKHLALKQFLPLDVDMTGHYCTSHMYRAPLLLIACLLYTYARYNNIIVIMRTILIE